MDISVPSANRRKEALQARGCVTAGSPDRMEGPDSAYRTLPNADFARKEIHRRLYSNRKRTRWLHVGRGKGGGTASTVVAANIIRVLAEAGQRQGTSVRALWPARPTPAVRQEQPRTHNRECGIQPAYQSLITDVLQFRLRLSEHRH